MGRAELRRALAARDGSCFALVPRLERHAARLEQLSAGIGAPSAEAVARSLRTAAGLYSVDGIVLAADGRLLTRALREPGARDIAGSAAIRLVLDVFQRLRPVLGERAGVALMLETPAALAQALELEPGRAAEQVLEAVRALAEAEPDVLLLIGPADEDALAAPERMAEHFGVSLVHLPADAEEADPVGVVRLTDEAFSDGAVPRTVNGAWLVTTRGEVPVDADPATVRRALESARMLVNAGGFRPMSGPYWNRELETMPWRAVEAWQDDQLATALGSIVERSAFYANTISRAQLDALRHDPRSGLAQLPLTTKDELRRAQEAHEPGRPLGRQQAVPLDQVIQFVSSSGTTGVPLYYGLTRADLDTWADACANTFFTAGVRDSDVVGHLVGLPMVAGGLAYADGYRRIGATLAWLGGFPTERILAALPRLEVSALMATTSFGLYLTETAASGAGPDPSTLGIRKLQLGGEPGLSNPEIRARIKQGWGTQHVREGMGLADVLAAMWSECEFEGGMHFNAQAAVVLELIDPDALTTVAWSEGATGEIVYTTLRREATPVIRYRSSDRVVVTATGCDCGRTSPRIQVIGRTDDMLIYKGMNVFPTAVRDVVLRSGTDAVAPYIRVWKGTPGQVRFDSPIPVDVELASDELGGDERAALVERIEAAVREHLQARVAVTLVPPHALPRSTHKSAIVAVRNPTDRGAGTGT